jgi:hypothetical protein
VNAAADSLPNRRVSFIEMQSFLMPGSFWGIEHSYAAGTKALGTRNKKCSNIIVLYLFYAAGCLFIIQLT